MFASPALRRDNLDLLIGACCITLSDMKGVLTIRIGSDLERMIDRLSRRSGRSRSEVVRDALKRQLSLTAFEQLRQRTMPFAEARGYLTDEDVFREVS